MVNAWTNWNNMFWDWEDDEIFGPGNVQMITDDYEPMVQEDVEQLIHELDILFCHGQLTDDQRTIIRDAINDFAPWVEDYTKVRLTLYLILINPDFNIIK